MKLYAPKYYLDFKCIAERCRHSCCIGWEIDIDNDTMKKYSALTEEYGKNIAESIEDSETPHFRLGEDERCPHLDSRGLCRIIKNLGDSYLCDICREHPRFYSDTPRGKEVGLGLSCEEACRIILASDGYADIIEIGEVPGEIEEKDFDSVSHRSRIFSILSDRSIKYPEKLRRISSLYALSPAEDAHALLSSLEYLDEAHRESFLCYREDTPVPSEHEPELERALAYFIYRHCSGAADEYEFRSSLGFSLFCERLLASCAISSALPLPDLARIISEEIEYSEDNTEAIKEEFLF